LRMTEAEIIKMCERLAFRYNNPAEQQDMIQEGIVRAYEILSEEPDAHPAKIYREVNRRIYDYVNFGCHALSIPPSDTARSLARGKGIPEGSSWLTEAAEALLGAMGGNYVEYDDSLVSDDVASPEEVLGDKEEAQIISQAILDKLDGEEALLIYMRYYEDMTQDEVSDELGITRQAISLRELKAVRKLRKALLRKL
jgi:RNA polymerase sigma factor (sigma-70 family)